MLDLIIASMFSGILGVLISTFYYRRYEKRKTKLEILRRIIAYRYVLTGGYKSEHSKEFFSALNEIYIIFNDSKKVINTIKKMHDDLGDVSKMTDNLISLIKVMCDELDIDYSLVNDSFFERPFTPNKTL